MAAESNLRGDAFMHFYGTIWRPPYEADSLLIQATAGCTHHACKFCTLYEDLPFRFRMSPLEEIEADLREAQLWGTDPMAMLSARLQGIPRAEGPDRTPGYPHPFRDGRGFQSGSCPGGTAPGPGGAGRVSGAPDRRGG